VSNTSLKHTHSLSWARGRRKGEGTDHKHAQVQRLNWTAFSQFYCIVYIQLWLGLVRDSPNTCTVVHLLHYGHYLLQMAIHQPSTSTIGLRSAAFWHYCHTATVDRMDIRVNLLPNLCCRKTTGTIHVVKSVK
jgi:hypothetical protein